MQQNFFLSINSGSATLKCGVFAIATKKEVLRITVERIGKRDGFFSVGDKRESKFFRTHQAALRHVVARRLAVYQITEVGHRIVHGGRDFIHPTVLDAAVVQKIRRLSPYAPLHNPVNLVCLRVARELLPHAKHIGFFDTSLFAQLPEKAKVYGLPYDLYEKHGVQKYGFHGTSHEFAAREGAKKIGKPFVKSNLITAHLGGGCSITAFSGGQAVETSMGFSPLAGLIMGTRSGDVDPAVLFFLQRRGIGYKKIEHMFWHESGLVGLSGFSDMREILAASGERVAGWKPQRIYTARERKRCRLALEKFVYVLQWHIAAYAGILGGVDAMIYTGGIGERSAVVRMLTRKGFAPLGKVPTIVVSANEELAMLMQWHRS